MKSLQAFVISSVFILMLSGCVIDNDKDQNPDCLDNCPTVANTDQADIDSDGIADDVDNCPSIANPDQADSNNNGVGNACDTADSLSDCNNADLDALKTEMLAEVNQARLTGQTCGNNGYFAPTESLSWNTKLTKAAEGHALDMATNNFFSHTGSNGSSISDRVNATQYTWNTIGENIAIGYSSISQVMAGWNTSPGHCKNIMNPRYTEIGAACIKAKFDTSNQPYWVQVFGNDPSSTQ